MSLRRYSVDFLVPGVVPVLYLAPVFLHSICLELHKISARYISLLFSRLQRELMSLYVLFEELARVLMWSAPDKFSVVVLV